MSKKGYSHGNWPKQLIELIFYVVDAMGMHKYFFSLFMSLSFLASLTHLLFVCVCISFLKGFRDISFFAYIHISISLSLISILEKLETKGDLF